MEPATLRLSGDLTIHRAEAIRGELASALALGGPVVIDCGESAEVDLTFIQLLLAAQATAARTGVALSMAGPPEGALRKALSSAGFCGDDGFHPVVCGLWGRRKDLP